MTNKTVILFNLNKKIEELKKDNKRAMEASVPSWCMIDHDRGMIDGIEFAIRVIEANMRDCENCIHHKDGGCEVWECKFEAKEEKSEDSDEETR